jgi:hypothetical protein
MKNAIRKTMKVTLNEIKAPLKPVTAIFRCSYRTSLFITETSGITLKCKCVPSAEGRLRLGLIPCTNTTVWTRSSIGTNVTFTQE